MMMPGSSRYDLEERNRRVVLEGSEVLNRTSQSITRSQQVAIETEQIGTQVIGELGEQRETLLRAKTRLTHADDELAQSRSLLRAMGRNVLYNKLILLLIIILEIVILGATIYVKYFSKK